MALNVSRAKHVFKKTGSKHLDAIVTERSMLDKPTKRKYQKEVLQRLDNKIIKECHRRSGKRNNGKCFAEKTVEKKHFTESEQIFTHGEVLLSQEQNSLRRFLENIERSTFATLWQIDSKSYFRKTSKTERSLEWRQYHTIFSSSISANNDFHHNHCRTRYLQSLHSSHLVETTRDIPTKSSFENSRKTLKRKQTFEEPRRNLRSNSSQHNGCGFYNENKWCHIENNESLSDENLCLIRSFKQHLCPI